MVMLQVGILTFGKENTVARADNMRIGYLQALLVRNKILSLPSAALSFGLEAIGQSLRLRRDPVTAETMRSQDQDGSESRPTGSSYADTAPPRSRHDNEVREHSDVLQTIAVDVQDALASSPTRRLIILGGPGTGKTTTLKQLLVSSARAALADASAPLPIYIALPDLARAGFNLSSYVGVLVANFGIAQETAATLRDAIEQGAAIICLDGLDELVPALRTQALAHINSWAAMPGNIWIVGSRFTEYKGGQFAPGYFTEWELLPLTQEQQLELARRMFLALGRKETQEATDAAPSAAAEISVRTFMDALEAHPTAGSWSPNPLLFSLAATAFAEQGQLPHSRAALYDGVVAGILAQREADAARRAALTLALGQLGLRVHARNGRVFTRGELEEQLPSILSEMKLELPFEKVQSVLGVWANRIIHSGVIEEVAHDSYSFRHQTFQEYLAAEALAARMISSEPTLRDGAWEFARSKRTYSRWTEIMRLLVGVLTHKYGQVGIQTAEHWVGLLLTQRDTQEGDPGSLGLALALRSLAEWEADSLPVTLATLGAERWASEIVKAIRGPRWSIFLQYLSLGEDIARLPLRTILGAVQILAILIDSTEDQIRMSATEALLPFGDRAPVNAMVRAMCASSAFERSRVLRGLARAASPALASALLEGCASADLNEQVICIEALGYLGTHFPAEAREKLHSALHHDELRVRAAAAFSLACLGDDTMLNTAADLAVLPDTWESPDSVPYQLYEVAKKAIESLGQIGEQGAPALLRAFARDKSSYGELRENVLRALARQGIAGSLELVVQGLQDESAHVRAVAARALGRLGQRAGVGPLLVASADDPNTDVRGAALQALGLLVERGTLSVPIEPLLSALQDSDSGVRSAALAVVERLEGPEAQEAIWSMVNDGSQWVRVQAVRALARHDAIGAEALIGIVATATAEDEKWLHDAAATTLAALGSRAPLDALIALLRSAFATVRSEGARALTNRPDDAPFEPLLDLLDDPEEYVRWRAGVALAAQGQRIPAPVLLHRLTENGSSMDVSLLLAIGAFSPHPPEQIVKMVRNALANADDRLSTTNDGDFDDDPWMYGIDNTEELPNEPHGQEVIDNEDASHQEYDDVSGTGIAHIQFGQIDATDLMRAAVRVTGGWAEDVLASSGVEHYLRAVVESNGDPQDAGPIAEATLARLDASRSLDYWTAELRDDSWTARAKAARMLGEFSDAHVRDLLGEAQHDAVGQVRLAGTASLGKTLARVEGHRGASTLLDFLRSDDVWLRRGALRGLANCKDAAPIVQIQAALDDADEELQDAAFDTLIELQAAIPEDVIRRRLGKLPEWMRSELVHDLGKLGAHAPVDLLVRILQNREPAIQGERELAVSYDRVAAAGALGDLGEAAPLEPLLEALQDDEFWVRGAAMQALGKLGRNAPVEIITAGLGSDDFHVRNCAAMACRHLGAAAPIMRLQQALGDLMSDMREAAQTTLAEVAPWALEEVLPEALAILSGESAGSIFGSMIQVNVARRLGAAGIASAAVFAMLTELLDWPYSQVREEACKALGEIRQSIPDTSIRRLLTLRGDPESEAVRFAADDALAKILSLETSLEDE
jgi:HEAT repeat protein